MLYEIAHVIKDNFSFFWEVVEWGNKILFIFQHKGNIKDIPSLLDQISTDSLIIRMTKETDAPKLAAFFKEQPENAFKFFKPHGFDEKSILKVIRNKSFLTFVVTEGEVIVGYFFLRCFANGKCFRGKIVHKKWQGKGIAKLMGKAMTLVSEKLNLRMFGSISPDNYASMASAKASNNLKVHKVLENGYFYIEFLPKSQE